MSNKKNIEPVDLKSFYRDRFDGSDLQKISLRNPVPHKCTSNGQEYYYYNANLSGLMNLKDKDGKLKYFEFETMYIKGFADGLKHLKNKEGIKRKDFNTPKKREILKKDLNHFLYKREFLTNHKGLKDFMDKTLLRWSEDSIYSEGYYNGLLHSILTLCDELNMDVFKNINNDNQTPNKKKAGQKAIPKLSAEQYLLVSEDDKQRFLDRLKDKFKDEGKKEFCYLLIGLNKLKLLNTESQQNVFEVITKFFGGYYGTYSNFNKHWTNPNNSDLLESTKKQIEDIKRTNIIM